MDTRLQFQKNASVLAANGQQLGHIERVVVNPETNVMSHFVVRKGSLFNKEDKIVPIDLVAKTTEDQVTLKSGAGDLEDLSAFEETYIVDEGGRTAGSSPSTGNPSVMLGYPTGGVVSYPPSPADRIATEVVQNIPEGTVALKEGAKVIAAEDEHVGSVERVLADPSADQVTHLLISRGMFTKETKLVPIKWVKEIDENEVHLRVKKDSVDELANAPVAG